jgi:hypothetical protein
MSPLGGIARRKGTTYLSAFGLPMQLTLVTRANKNRLIYKYNW